MDESTLTDLNPKQQSTLLTTNGLDRSPYLSKLIVFKHEVSGILKRDVGSVKLPR